jgi:hypothetical protein
MEVAVSEEKALVEFLLFFEPAKGGATPSRSLIAALRRAYRYLRLSNILVSSSGTSVIPLKTW